MKSTQKMSADAVYYNGNIYTMKTGIPTVSAIATKGQYILAAGSNEDVKQYIRQQNRDCGFKGGLCDTRLIEGHTHLIKFGEVSMQIDCFWKSRRKFLQIRQKVQTLQPGEWIQSDFGWNNEVWEDKSYPSKEELDAAAPDNLYLWGDVTGICCG